MSPSRRVLTFALALMTLTAAVGAGEAAAQLFESTLKGAGLPSEISRSPRLLGMGRLTLSVPDRDHQISLWDLCGNPTGLFWDDSVSTLDIRPGTGSTANAHDLSEMRMREDLTGRSTSLPLEFVHRSAKGSAVGVVSEVRSTRAETPFTGDVNLHRSVGEPNVMAIANGPFPWLLKEKLRYALRLRFSNDHLEDEFRTFTENAAGQFMTQGGSLVDGPNFFDPNDWNVYTQGIGAAFSYPLGRSHVAAIGADAIHQRVRGTNEGGRHSSEVMEERPTKIGQASLVGHFGRSLEYGVDGRGWLSQSPQDWSFSLSAGVGGFPLRGRGHLLKRDEKGSSLNSRVRWTSGAFALGGQFWTRAGDLEITPPHPNDAGSLNRFLSWVWYRAWLGHAGVSGFRAPDHEPRAHVGIRYGRFGQVQARHGRGGVALDAQPAGELADRTGAAARGPRRARRDRVRLHAGHHRPGGRIPGL